MTERIAEDGTPIPLGIVGAGRTRNGLGPFLAEFLEKEGFVVTGVSGRSPERAAANAQTIGQVLGHEVKAFANAVELCAAGVGALAIASPAEFHLEALRAAVAAGLPTLCEKPLVHEDHGEEGMAVIEAFARKPLPLVENCQWPNVLSAFFELHGNVETGEELRVEMGLGPPRKGRDMVQNTLPHLLSVIQAIEHLEAGATVTDVSLADPSFGQEHNLLSFRLVTPEKTVQGALHLKICTVAPRPAWLAINGRRMDRHVREGYMLAFSANGVEVIVADPTKEVVKRFTQLVRARNSVLMDDEHYRIRQRLTFYRQILQKLE